MSWAAIDPFHREQFDLLKAGKVLLAKCACCWIWLELFFLRWIPSTREMDSDPREGETCGTITLWKCRLQRRVPLSSRRDFQRCVWDNPPGLCWCSFAKKNEDLSACSATNRLKVYVLVWLRSVHRCPLKWSGGTRSKSTSKVWRRRRQSALKMWRCVSRQEPSAFLHFYTNIV